MKGVSKWFWIAGGIIAGLIIFSIGYNQILQLNLIRTEQRSLEQYDETKNIINNLCWSSVGNEREYTIAFAKTVEGMYVTADPYQEYDREQLINKILAQEKATGNFLCIKIKDKRLNFQELECDADMPFLGSVPIEFSLSALVNKIMGRGEVFTYPLYFKREESVVKIDSIESSAIITSTTTTISGTSTSTTVLSTTTTLTTSTTTTSSTTTTIPSYSFTMLLDVGHK